MKYLTKISKQSLGFVAGLVAGVAVVAGVGVAFAVNSAQTSHPIQTLQPNSEEQSSGEGVPPSGTGNTPKTGDSNGGTTSQAPSSSAPSGNQPNSLGRNAGQPPQGSSSDSSSYQPVPQPVPSGPSAEEIAAVQAEREWYNLEIQNSQARIASMQADLELKKYFLSVANAYGDHLKAGQINAEILTIQASIANENAYLIMITAQRDALPNY